jgi:hypothetical protein
MLEGWLAYDEEYKAIENMQELKKFMISVFSLATYVKS